MPPVFALGLAAALAGLGALFTAAPDAGARLFGLPKEDDADWIRALGFRDVALAAGLAGAAAAGPRSLAVLAGAAALIPALDLALVAQRRGLAAAPQLALHGLSALALGSLAAASLRRSRPKVAHAAA